MHHIMFATKMVSHNVNVIATVNTTLHEQDNEVNKIYSNPSLRRLNRSAYCFLKNQIVECDSLKKKSER